MSFPIIKQHNTTHTQHNTTQHNTATMMLTPEHRRSTRTRKAPVRLVNEPKSKSKESNYKDFDYEDVYGECPIAPVGFEYDREYYLASSRYATYIDDEIAKINRKQKSEVEAKSEAEAIREAEAILSRDYEYNVHKLIYAENSDKKYFATSLLFQSPPSSDLPIVSFRRDRDHNNSKYLKK
jgi:hypothetical protein